MNSLTEISSRQQPIKLLLINPRLPESFWSFKWATKNILPNKKAINPPLGLATLAALCPADWQVTIVDENIESLPFNPQADIVGICGMAVQFSRQTELLAWYRSQGYYVVTGGSYTSLCSEDYRDKADTIIAGEAERIWPQFCLDYEQGTAASLYQETRTVDLKTSPTPRFDLLKLDKYSTASMQFSRGCPYQCDFCDIIIMFGRKPRAKSMDQIGLELDLLRSRNVHNIFFVDDNLIGNKKVALQLLHYLADYQQHNNYYFRFGTEVSINLAGNNELLKLMRAANFTWVFIGIESPDKKSLKEANKGQNIKIDLLQAVQTIYQFGIDVLAGFIIGFDNDSLETFEKQYQFIRSSGIQVAMIGLLIALPKTPLYLRLEKEGRLIPKAACDDNTKPGTNFIPKSMSYDDMVQSYETLYWRLFNNKNIALRIHNKVKYLQKLVRHDEYTPKQYIKIVGKLLPAIIKGGPGRLYYFTKNLITTKPSLWPAVLVDWIAGLSMQDYIRRHFSRKGLKEHSLIQRTLSVIRRFCATEVSQGNLEISLNSDTQHSNLLVSLHGKVNAIFLNRVSRRLKRLLRKSSMTFTLNINYLSLGQVQKLDRMLKRLARYGDRISIRISRQIKSILTIDSSVFHVVIT